MFHYQYGHSVSLVAVVVVAQGYLHTASTHHINKVEPSISYYQIVDNAMYLNVSQHRYAQIDPEVQKGMHHGPFYLYLYYHDGWDRDSYYLQTPRSC